MTSAPPIPISCAARPTIGGVVVPYVNVRLRDGGVDFRAPDNTRYERCWTEQLCQTCGRKLGRLAVFFGGPNQLRSRQFDEPHVCTECAPYVSKACPMVAGRLTHYADRERLADGPRGELSCNIPDCRCARWVESVPASPGTAGSPAHDWYALYVPLGGWVLTGEQQQLTVGGRPVERTIINGALLTVEPKKVLHVSTPGAGRVWQRTEMPPAAPDVCQRPKTLDGEPAV